MREVVLATRSPGKIRELRPLIAAAGWTVRTLDELGVAVTPQEAVIEGFDTFEANARAKAHFFAPLVGGRAVIAEDSGLCVDALGGAPGVHSRRWSGREDLDGGALDAANNQVLEARMMGVAATDRSARYVCVAVWLNGDAEVIGRGETAGRILETRSEGGGGFGYDCWFWSTDLRRSFAAASMEDKAHVSHRGRAIRELLGAVASR